MAAPRYTSGGALERPSGFEGWVFVGSSLGLGYSEHSSREGPGDFHTVYTQPEVFAAYRDTGRFPEKAMFVLALHEPRQRESIANQGYFQGELVALEVAVKDRERFQEGWAYFDFGKGGLDPSGRALPPESCHRCHVEHGADDNVFVQFYPPLRSILEARKGVPVSTSSTR
jgi:cytochrome P460